MADDYTKLSQEVLERVKKEGVTTIWIWFVDILGHLKSFAITPSELEGAFKDGMGFDGSSISGFNAIEESDLVAKPDPSTFRLIPWNDHGEKACFMFADILNPDKTPYQRDPRYILKRTVEKARQQGFTMYVGPELEYFYFRSDQLPPEVLDHGGYFSGPPVDYGHTLRYQTIEALEKLDIPVEYHHHEVGPSQHEIDLRFDEVTRMADKCIIYRWVVKEVARRNGVYATFMPKPLEGENGSGMHTHQSLFKDGKNAFFDENDPDYLSQIARSYLAGILKYAEQICVFLSQHVNSYKRLVPGYEAPVYIAWSRRNRSALVRVPEYHPGKEAATRIELRSPDPACNPYLAFAMMLAAGLKGIEEGLEVEPPIHENLYELTELQRIERGIKNLPSNLNEALHHAKNSELVKEVLGEEAFLNFLDLKYREWDKYRTQVTRWELEHDFSVL